MLVFKLNHVSKGNPRHHWILCYSTCKELCTNRQQKFSSKDVSGWVGTVLLANSILSWALFHKLYQPNWVFSFQIHDPVLYQFNNYMYQTTVETLYSTIYYSKYFIELNFDKSTQNVALWTHKRHPIPRPFGRAMECLLWVLQQKLTVL